MSRKQFVKPGTVVRVIRKHVRYGVVVCVNTPTQSIDRRVDKRWLTYQVVFSDGTIGNVFGSQISEFDGDAEMARELVEITFPEAVLRLGLASPASAKHIYGLTWCEICDQEVRVLDMKSSEICKSCWDDRPAEIDDMMEGRI